jgi:hypothetical protein
MKRMKAFHLVEALMSTSGLAFANASYTRSLRISFNPALMLSFLSTCSDIDMWLSDAENWSFWIQLPAAVIQMSNPPARGVQRPGETGMSHRACGLSA